MVYNGEKMKDNQNFKNLSRLNRKNKSRMDRAKKDIDAVPKNIFDEITTAKDTPKETKTDDKSLINKLVDWFKNVR